MDPHYRCGSRSNGHNYTPQCMSMGESNPCIPGTPFLLEESAGRPSGRSGFRRWGSRSDMMEKWRMSTTLCINDSPIPFLLCIDCTPLNCNWFLDSIINWFILKMTEYKGKCHCGEVEFTTKLAEPNHILWFSTPASFQRSISRRWLHYSHCDTCKYLGGGAYTLNQIVPEEDFKITKGSTKTYTYYGDSGSFPYTLCLREGLRIWNPESIFDDCLGKPVHCYYCPNCTTHVYHHQTVMGPKVIVRTILLDGGKDMTPAAEIYGKVRLNWEKEVAHTFETLPPS